MALADLASAAAGRSYPMPEIRGGSQEELPKSEVRGSSWEELPHALLKSRDITFPTKVHLVKAMVFPVVMYGCEGWTVKKAEHQRIDAFELWC